MGRIISGVLGSIRLSSPAKASRPTTDRVRESLFALLEARGLIEEARVLDLFAGTGALALESISRGAASAVLVERDRRAARVIRENLAVAHKALMQAGVTVEMRLIEGAVRPKIEQLANAGARFDLIFADPPYDFTDSQLADELQGVQAILAEDGLLILERARTGFSAQLAGLTAAWEKAYGDTRVIALAR